ncbi:hypothetical protein [Streptomyces sp. NPDC018321]|uniref:hypothetical protein n=1 Tax=unclassified Streptomyces TaxID=2593676 RepID=UPI0037AE4EE5
MPFGSADRATLGEIARQVKDIGESVTARKQQVSDQQHVIDQIRRDATGAISTGPLTLINNEFVAAVREITGRPCHDSDGKPDHTDTSPDAA